MTTFHVGQQTDPVVLPQRRALESESADNPEGGDETGRGHCHLAVTGVEHGRGEIGSEGTRPIRRHAEGASVSEGENREVHPVVFVLDVRGHPLDPCHPARARRLLTAGRAVVHRHTGVRHPAVPASTSRRLRLHHPSRSAAPCRVSSPA
ncbi:RRXRR domain-containing protein [Streptosporangium sp. NPDC049248]|uniref:RRXRR domain-containing protein n=1 Tax=Streptosporangium sp. NPDC049248 TaxID=3155651 RepID=UPI003431D483